MAEAGATFGRSEELAALHAVVTRLRSGSPAGIALSGAPGVGKSHLLEAVAASGQVRVHRLAGFEAERHVPLAAAASLLRSTGILEDPSGLDGTPLVGVFERVYRALAASPSAARRPSLLLVDDLQWVDETSAALLHYLARGATHGRAALGFALALRPGPDAETILGDLRRVAGSWLVELAVDPLRPSDAAELARSVLPAEAAMSAEEVAARAAGSPFWIRVLARGGSQPADAIRELAPVLESDAAALIEVLAVAGRPRPPALIGRALGWPPGRVAMGLRQLERRGITATQPDGVRLSHDLVREAALGRIPAVRLREMHRRLAAALESEAGADAALLRTVIVHRRAGGLACRTHVRRLVRSAERRWLDGGALDELWAIMESEAASDDEPASDDGPGAGTWTPVALDIARLTADVGARDAALARWRQLVPRLEGEARLEAALGWAAAAFALRLPGEVRAALATTGLPGGPESRVLLLAAEARARLWLDGDPDSGAELADDALRLARSALGAGADRTARRRQARLAALTAAFDGAMQRSRWRTLQAIATELSQRAAGASPSIRIDAEMRAALAARTEGDLPAARDHLQEALRLADARVLPALAVDAGRLLAAVLHAMGDLAGAHRVAQDAAALARRVAGTPWYPGHPEAERLRARMAWEAWRPLLGELIAVAEREPDPHYRLSHWSWIARWLSHAGTGAVGETLAALERIDRDMQAAGCPRCTQECQAVIGCAYARLGRPAEAAERLALLQVDPELVEPWATIERDWGVALCLPPAEAAAALGMVVSSLEACSRRVDANWARLDLARAQLATEVAAGVASLRDAEARAKGMGHETQRRIALELLRRAGIRSWTRSPRARLGRLTLRETEVARLVSTGATNGEIATLLRLSPRTVEHHVSSALNRLGARNRAELVARLMDADAAE